MQKLLADEHGQHVMAAAQRLAGPGAMVAGAGPAGRLGGTAANGPTAAASPSGRTGRGSESADPIWSFGFLFSPALTIGGGTWAVQRNIVAERSWAYPTNRR